jgi:hypothetical protein
MKQSPSRPRRTWDVLLLSRRLLRFVHIIRSLGMVVNGSKVLWSRGAKLCAQTNIGYNAVELTF